MKNTFTSNVLASHLLGAALAVSMLSWSATPASAARTPEELQQFGAKLAGQLARACPHTPNPDNAAYEKCSAALRQMTDLPINDDMLWGNDQPALPIKNRKLTHFNGEVFRTSYLPMFAFTGRFILAKDEQSKMDVIKVEAYFRNNMPPGNYPYPFWHSATTWDQFQNANVVNFYMDAKGGFPMLSRSADGRNENRGPYANVTPPAFVKDQWMWTDASGQQQPRIMLFASRYQAANPSLPRLDDTYRAFAESMREASCMSCHNPKNPVGMNRLVLFQTPLHAAGEIDRVIRSVRGGSMPENDIGLPADIDPKLRETIVKTAQAFRDELIAANQWEVSHRAPQIPAAAAAR